MCLTGLYTERGIHKKDGFLTELVVDKEQYIVKVSQGLKHVAVFSEPLSIAEKAMEQAFGKKPLPQRGGGSIPIVAMFDQVLKAKSVLMGFGLDSDDIHSPNEHYGLFNFYKGIETIPYFYKNYAEMKK